jgi:pimeloyl-ACP methyl ester carboxylesterase
MTRLGFCLSTAALLGLAACRPPGPPAPTFASLRISVVTTGRGSDVILIGGLAAHRDVWNAVTKAVGRKYRVHLVQVNGFAGFPAQANATGPVSSPVAEEVARYIRESGLREPAVVGHSMGGTIAMMLAARHPELVGRLMVVEAIPFLGMLFAGPTATAASVQTLAEQTRAQMAAGTPGSATDPLEQMIPSMTRSDAMRPVLLQYARMSDRRTASNAVQELIVTDLRPELARITAPTTVLYVQRPGPQGSPEDLDAKEREMFASLPGVRLVRVDNSNHYVQIDQPSVVVAELEALMRVSTH